MDKRRVIYYDDELNNEFSTAVIEPRRIDKNYKYIHTSLFKRFTHFFWYRMVATPIALFYIKLFHRQKTVGKEKVRPYKKVGYFLYGNHTHHLCDTIVPSLVSMPKDAYVVVHPSNVSMKYLGRVTPSMGAIPLPDDFAAYKNFIKALEYRYSKGKAIAIYPEAHIWPYYTGIRPFESVSFRYPVRLNAPVFSFVNTYKHRGKSDKARVVTYIDGPFFPDTSLPERERVEKLRDEVYAAMCERAKLSDIKIIEYIKKTDSDGSACEDAHKPAE